MNFTDMTSDLAIGTDLCPLRFCSKLSVGCLSPLLFIFVLFNADVTSLRLVMRCLIVLVGHYRQNIEAVLNSGRSCWSVPSCKWEKLIDGRDPDEGQCLDSWSLGYRDQCLVYHDRSAIAPSRHQIPVISYFLSA